MKQMEGRSIKEIASLLGVSRSSVSLWVRDIPLTEEQHLALRLRNPIYNGQQAGARANAERARERRGEEYAGFRREEWLDGPR